MTGKFDPRRVRDPRPTARMLQALRQSVRGPVELEPMVRHQRRTRGLMKTCGALTPMGARVLAAYRGVRP